MEFHFNNWLVFFYIYSILGWVFESVNVSVRQKRWVNRGFMKGPWLPIYGSGAVVILIASLPFSYSPVAVYFAGAVAATILEYFTGEIMLAIFKVRYWDYRYRKIQYKGHICLVSTVAWGFLSIMMVYGIHPVISGWLDRINEEVVSVVVFVVTLCIAYDFANSFREAMDVRALIIQANELKKHLEKSVEDAKELFTERVEDTKEQLAERMEEAKEYFAEQVEEWKDQLDERKLVREERKMENIEELRYRIRNIHEKLEKYSKPLLLRNPGAVFLGLEEETKEIKAKLQKLRSRNEESEDES